MHDYYACYHELRRRPGVSKGSKRGASGRSPFRDATQLKVKAEKLATCSHAAKDADNSYYYRFKPADLPENIEKHLK